ncbi:MAG: hypoxanthine phosphoribosyltransferase [Lentisphaerae bacterium]|jgi:hypoxanthine phosphoribosyltransferase|nr:hypoxanthine phosphoribosyltransferase [Lentisphaerota bacterium]
MNAYDVKEILIDKNAIAERVDELIDAIAEGAEPGNLVVIGILKGSFMFLADLMRSFHRHDIRPRIDFITLSSYGAGTVSSGTVTVIHDIREDIAETDILLVDDILDTGRTLAFSKKLFLQRGARSVQSCVLLDKKVPRAVEFEADYVGFAIDDHFVVGYGLDYNNYYRELPHIAKLHPINEEPQRCLPIDRELPEIVPLAKAHAVLNEGGLVIVPTETVYGIACNPEVPGAMEKLIAAKGRDGDKPIARLAADPQQVEDLAIHWSRRLQSLAEKYWPGALTIVLETAEGWTGFRVPNHAVALQLARICRTPLALTSANLSGEPDTRTAQEAMASVEADLVLDSGPSAEQAIPSTVVKVDGDRIECLRQGKIPFEEIEYTFKHQDTKDSKDLPL